MISTILDVSMNCMSRTVDSFSDPSWTLTPPFRCHPLFFSHFLRPEACASRLGGLKRRTYLISPSIRRRLRHFALLFVLHIYHKCRLIWIWATLLSVFFSVDCEQSIIFLCKAFPWVTHARLSHTVTLLFTIALAWIITERISREKAGSLISVYFNLLSADVGGNMGLFLGCSLLTLCEFVDLIVIMCLQCWRKKNAVVHAREDQFR